jgi:hypothetical protein
VIHHRYLYPRKTSKSTWTIFPADGKAAWEHEKKVGVFEPETPSTESGDEGVVAESSEILNFDEYTLEAGEVVKSITLHCYCNPNGGGGLHIFLQWKEESKLLAEVTPTTSAYGWHSCTRAGTLTQEQVNNLMSRLKTITTKCKSVALYIDLETETPELVMLV